MTEAFGVVRVRIHIEGEMPSEDQSVQGQRVKGWLRGCPTVRLLHLLRWIMDLLRERGVVAQ